ncbi:phosphotransferase [Streptomyces sp. NPDC001139]
MHRVEWADLPPAARAAVERHTGPVERAETAPHGVMSRLACTIHTQAGREFVKGIPEDDPQAWVYRHEAQVTTRAPQAPQVLWEVHASGWRLYGYEYVQGRYPNLTPGSSDVPALVATLTILSKAPWPEVLSKKPLHERWVGFLPDRIPDEMYGRGLAHTDMSPHNMLVTPSDELVLLDWALACPGPAWADTALTIPRLISAGHSPDQAEKMAQRVPAYHAAERDTVTVFARTIHTAWEDWQRTRPLPHRAALTAAARIWAEWREAGSASHPS